MADMHHTPVINNDYICIFLTPHNYVENMFMQKSSHLAVLAQTIFSPSFPPFPRQVARGTQQVSALYKHPPLLGCM
jgi:hypothetical protein